MKFMVTEVKLLTGGTLSIRLREKDERADDNGVAYTIHAVTPFGIAGINPAAIGDVFEFALVEKYRK